MAALARGGFEFGKYGGGSTLASTVHDSSVASFGFELKTNTQESLNSKLRL
jgi:hypothetical protein